MDMMFSNRFFKKKLFPDATYSGGASSPGPHPTTDVLESALEPAPDFMHSPPRWHEQRPDLSQLTNRTVH
jgi:hypothetical protein